MFVDRENEGERQWERVREREGRKEVGETQWRRGERERERERSEEKRRREGKKEWERCREWTETRDSERRMRERVIKIDRKRYRQSMEKWTSKCRQVTTYNQ